MRAFIAAIALSLTAIPASATNSKPELMKVLEDFMAWMPGEYSSVPQVFLERNLGTPPDGEHDLFYRVFAEIEAPHLAEHVIYTQIRLDGDDGPVFPGQQVVFLISIDEELGAVSISGRRIKDPHLYVDAHLRPDVWPELQPDPNYGGNCSFNWRRHGKQLRGLLGEFGKCTMISKNTGQQMTWDAEWILNPDELWIYDNGYLEDGSLISGRLDRTHLRMYKARRYECFAALRHADGNNQVINPFFMHDRGDVYTITTEEPEPRDIHLEFLTSLWPSSSGRNFVDLARLTLHDGEPGAYGQENVIGNAWATPESGRVGFSTEWASARCKLADPDDPRFIEAMRYKAAD
ncbi:MAG: CpcT/CpeT family chromophore lyase [Gammaproteobacteria bacterium]|nr:CpcT/CpeT family chromophore lyase [Gammaproteobacteria bacterium]